VPEDRRNHGLLLAKSVRENLTLSVIQRFTRFGITDPKREGALVDEMIATLKIKTGTPEQLAGTLSGGNQQKVIFGKMLLTEARILLLYDPTRGIDVGTKGEIFQLMRDLAAKGYAILFYSSDLCRAGPCRRPRRRSAQWPPRRHRSKAKTIPSARSFARR
jgi:ribose transport system ATP-binding protein